LIQEMNARQLEKVKMEGERQVEAKRRECEAGSQRNRGVKEAVQVARANSGAYAQQITEKVRGIAWFVIVPNHVVCGYHSVLYRVCLPMTPHF